VTPTAYDPVVDNDEARAIATARLEQLRAAPYGELSRRLLGRQETEEVVGPSVTRYQLELQAVLDGVGENLRVMIAVDDGGLRSFAPLAEDFVVTPDGSLVGE
jgi:hypothetical protein